MRILSTLMLIPIALALSAERVSLCQIFEEPSKFAGKIVELKGYIKPLMHGTYLKQEGCDQGILIVLPEEIPNYKGSIRLVKDSEFEVFKKARFNYQPGTPQYSAVFTGMIEYKKDGKGFGYYKTHRVRLIVQSITEGVTEQSPHLPK